MVFRIRLMGTVELCVDDRHASPGSPKQQLVLSALAWDAGRFVRADTLAHRVWGDAPPRGARQSLYSHVSRVRKAMAGLAGHEAPPITGRTDVYRLETAPETVDVHLYLRQTDDARALLDRGRLQDAFDLLTSAARLWRGEPLTGLSGDWPEHVRETLAERHLAAAVWRADVGLRLGRYTDVVVDLSPLANDHPTDETVAHRLALALYGSGRVTDADRVLRRARHQLIRELGTDPGEQLRQVERGIMHRVPVVDLLPHAGPSERYDRDIRAPGPDNLPGDVAWVGRRSEMTQLLNEIASRSRRETSTVVAIDGMPGVGKTSLAVHLAHQVRDQFPHGRIMLDLRAHTAVQPPLTPAAALTELLLHFGIPPDQLPRDLERLVTLWRTTMSTRRALIILDDAADHSQVRPLLPGTSPSLVIITSRHRLTGLVGVRPVSLDLLPQSDAVALFHDRVGTSRELDPTGAREIVRQCGYLPLAIEVVAGRLLSHPSWTISDLLTRLTRSSGRLREFRAGPTEIINAFELSYRDLDTDQRHLFLHVSIFVGPEFGTYAAAALAGWPVAKTERALEDLLDAHLLFEPSSHRYRMHDLLREFARELADATLHPEQVQRAVDRLIDTYVHTADLADRAVYPHRSRIDVTPTRAHTETRRWLDEVDAQQWFRSEAPNLLALLDHCHRHSTPHRAAVLVHVLAGFLDTAGYLGVALPHLRRAVSHWRTANDRAAELRALLDLSTVSAHASEYHEALDAASRALDISREIGEADVEVEVIHQLAILRWHTGNYLEALPEQRRALDIRLQKPDRLQQARSMNMLGVTLLHLGEHEEAQEKFLSALELFRAVGYYTGEYRTLNNLAELQARVGNIDEARRYYGESMRLVEATGSRVDLATVQMNLATALIATGDIVESLNLYRKALPAFQNAGDKRNESIALNGLGKALQAAGRYAEALEHHTAALRVARHIAAPNEEAQALRSLAVAEYRSGRPQAAVEHLRASLAIVRRLHSPAELAETLAALAQLTQESGEETTAARLRRELATIHARLGAGKKP